MHNVCMLNEPFILINEYVSLTYFLLTSKSTNVYVLNLTKLRMFLPATYSPNVEHVDFEIIIRTAVVRVWLQTTVEGYCFYLGQA